MTAADIPANCYGRKPLLCSMANPVDNSVATAGLIPTCGRIYYMSFPVFVDPLYCLSLLSPQPTKAQQPLFKPIDMNPQRLFPFVSSELRPRRIPRGDHHSRTPSVKPYSHTAFCATQQHRGLHNRQTTTKGNQSESQR